MSMVIGLTGGIASGKTTIANLFQQHFAIDIVDADIVAREVVMPNSDGLNAIINHFGQHILHPDGTLNRAALREIIFAHEEEKQWLNHLLHPMIRQQMQQQLDSARSEYVLFVVPLLIENNLLSMIDRLLVIDVDEQTQIQRTVKRDNVSIEQAKSILNAQTSRQQRLELADDIIENTNKNDDLLQQVSQLHQQYLALSKQRQRQC